MAAGVKLVALVTPPVQVKVSAPEPITLVLKFKQITESLVAATTVGKVFTVTARLTVFVATHPAELVPLTLYTEEIEGVTVILGPLTDNGSQV